MSLNARYRTAREHQRDRIVYILIVIIYIMLHFCDDSIQVDHSRVKEYLLTSVSLK